MMKILLLHDKESLSYDDINLTFKIKTSIENSNNEIKCVTLDGDKIKSCIGCFNCWVKTPGICFMKDDGVNTISRHEIQADIIIILSKITYGAYSYDIKSFLDRSIPNILPFFEIVDNEMHHKMRYKRFPIIISIGYGTNTIQECQTFIELTERNALNFRPPKHFVFILENIGRFDEILESLNNVLSKELLE